jgi:hypothetical protein
VTGQRTGRRGVDVDVGAKEVKLVRNGAWLKQRQSWA